MRRGVVIVAAQDYTEQPKVQPPKAPPTPPKAPEQPKAQPAPPQAPPPATAKAPEPKKQQEFKEEARTPQNSLEAEQGLIGCILLEPDTTLAECRRLITPGPEVFYDQRCQTIYTGIMEMTGKLDTITLTQWLRDRSLLEVSGGLKYISELLDSTPSASNLQYYAQIVMEKWMLRAIGKACETAAEAALDGTTDPSKLAAKLTGQVASATMAVKVQKEIRDLTHQIQDTANARKEGTIPPGTEIGIRSVDRILKGLDAEMVVIAARPSMGKTSMGCTIARNLSKRYPAKMVGFITLEMTDIEITTRIIEGEANMSYRMYSQMDDYEIRQMQMAAASVGRMPIKIHYADRADIGQVCAIASAWASQFELSGVVIDQVSKIKGSKNYYQKRDEYAEITSRISSLRNVVKCPIFLLAQLNREAELERPTLSNLKESSSLEEDAQSVWFLWQPTGTEKRLTIPTVDAEVIIAKRRGGETGEAKVVFHRRSGVFCDHDMNGELPV